jgi:hypothetical protein
MAGAIIFDMSPGREYCSSHDRKSVVEAILLMLDDQRPLFEAPQVHENHCRPWILSNANMEDASWISLIF